MKNLVGIALGILTAIGGFVDVGAVVTSGEAGSKFGLGLIWVLLVATFAIMLLVEMSGRFAAVSKKPYAAAIREHFGFKFYLVPLTAELLANSLMLPAEMGGVSIALALLTGISWHIWLPLVAMVILATVWRAPFGLIENGPALLGLVTLSFLVGIVMLGGPQKELVPTLWHPDIKAGELAEYLFLAAAILGAIISPYLIFFYSSGAREERWSRKSLGLNRVTAVVGMGFGSITAIAITVLAAMVLKPLDIGAGTLAEVGLTMAKPFGQLGGYLFAFTLLVTCFGACLEVVLSMGYNVSQGFGWEWGEEKKPVQAPRFNLVMVVMVVVSVLIGLIGTDPLQLALLGSVFTALVLPLSLLPFLIIMNDRDYVGSAVNGRLSNIGTVVILALAFVVAAVSMPLLILTGGG
ncbi:MAG: divalent metal cation transporter [Candidatus Dormibacteraeota bacterium]|nr:divalent metal cation transporter [Candidatus Dormibacteraeota bacterium]